MDTNMIIGNNIRKLLKERNIKQTELAGALGTNKQTVSKMIYGNRMITAIELRQIASFLGVSMEEITRIEPSGYENGIKGVFLGCMDLSGENNAISIADRISDLIVFHAEIKRNSIEMMGAWDND